MACNYSKRSGFLFYLALLYDIIGRIASIIKQLIIEPTSQSSPLINLRYSEQPTNSNSLFISLFFTCLENMSPAFRLQIGLVPIACQLPRDSILNPLCLILLR
ncbi:hypothetical protein L596_023891 [Steinernema carpocapsae]|uniref:Uncharacterized protein n=1 Tax=Steinernema carpocapsae TaxID=34508 RepID=A0A4U5MF29_STECR|nr:hypothetical protein L596_023891 [Steinernema carpocapsae]